MMFFSTYMDQFLLCFFTPQQKYHIPSALIYCFNDFVGKLLPPTIVM